MGCCESHNTSTTEETLNNIQQAIRRDIPERLNMLLKSFFKVNPYITIGIDSPVMKVNSYNFTLLSYSVWQGSFRSFKCLYEKYQASLIEMEKNLSQYEFTALDLLCSHNSIELLKYYIPLYVENLPNFPVFDLSKNFNPNDPPEVLSNSIYTPVHKACESENISILLIINNYFQNNSSIPKPLDPDYQEESTGENCVLIACRKISYPLIKFLHTKAKANFFVVNAKGEDAIFVLFAANRIKKKESFFNCLVYLVEKVRLDVSRKIEELMMMAIGAETVRFLESQDRRFGKKIENSCKTVVLALSGNVNETLPKAATLYSTVTAEESWKTALSSSKYLEDLN